MKVKAIVTQLSKRRKINIAPTQLHPMMKTEKKSNQSSNQASHTTSPMIIK